MRETTGEDYGNNYLQAEELIAKLIHEHNEQRLHAVLGYMKPAVWHRGNPPARRAERARKPYSAKAMRRAINKRRR